MIDLNRLHSNKKAIIIYQRDLKDSIKNKSNFDIYINLSNILHWIIMTEELLKEYNKENYIKKRNENNKDTLMEGLRFANNSMKHDMVFSSMHTKSPAIACGSQEAICGTFSVGSGHIVWSEIKLRKGTNKKQYKCYNEKLKYRNIMESLDKAVDFLIGISIKEL